MENKKPFNAIYLCAKDHRLRELDMCQVYYNDIQRYSKPLDFECDCMEVDLMPYDLLIATPPCNYWSKANNRFRETSLVSQITKHILPDVLDKFDKTGKYWIVENVDNMNLMRQHFDADKYFWFRNGHHIWFTNLLPTLFDKNFICPRKHLLPYGHRDANPQVDYILNLWLETAVEFLTLQRFGVHPGCYVEVGDIYGS